MIHQIRGHFRRSKSRKKKAKKLAAENQRLQQENQQLRQQLQFCGQMAAMAPFMMNAMQAGMHCGYNAAMQGYAAQFLGQQSAMLQASVLGGMGALMANGGTQGLVMSSGCIAASDAFGSANGRFNAYQMIAFQHSRF